MARRRRSRTLKELLALLKSDPGQLTRSELDFVRRELKRSRAGGAEAEGQRGTYEQVKAEAAARRRALSRSGRDIGELPPVADQARKRAALADLRTFCETYGRLRFRLAWSPVHLAILAALQTTITQGGRQVMAIARGFGKTSLLEMAALWAVLQGRHPFVQLIGSSRGHALEMLASIRNEIEENDLLSADFPEVCYPIQCLDGIANRAAGQLYNGRRTRIGVTKEELILPAIAGSPASGAILRVTGITGRIRGRKHRLVRPSLVLLDDPQTEASAHSLAQVEKRESTIDQAVLGLAGPDQEIAVLLAGTVVAKGDLMDRFLDPARHPGWIQQRYPMLISWPTNLPLWEQYWAIRAGDLHAGGDGSQATAFYRDRRELMDAGAQVAWPERMKPGEISALQGAMNLYYSLGAAAFAAEYQNQPEEKRHGGSGQLTVEALTRQTNGLARGAVPLWATHLTAAVDVQQRVLFWLVAGWSDDFTGAVLDCGAYPEQPALVFSAATAVHTLARAAPGAGVEAAILAGLQQLVPQLLERSWSREDGTVLGIERLLVDCGYATDTVFAAYRQLLPAQQQLALPCKGYGLGAKSLPFSDYQPRPGERRGLGWLLKPAAGNKQAARTLLIDTYYWKSFLRDRLQQAPGDAGALTLWGQPTDRGHALLLDHATAEYWVQTEGRGRIVHEWMLKPGRRENHLWDCLVYAAAAAGTQGCARLAGQGQPALGAAKPRVRWSEVLKARRAARREEGPREQRG